MNEIVVGLDPMSTPDRVLDLALAEAERTGCPVRVVHCVAPYPWAATNSLGYPLTPTTVPDLDELRRAAQEQVEATIEKAVGRRLEPAAVTVTCEVLDGDAGRVLSDLSAKASLTVVGGEHHGLVTRALLGSTTTYVLHHAHGPVLVVPEAASGEPLSRVVVGLDGSEGSRAAFVHAVDIATARGCTLVAVHVFDLTSGSVIGPWLDLPGFSETQRAGLDWLDHEVAREAPAAMVPIERRAVPGPTAKALLAEARPSDLLVLGSRGHGGFTGLVLGSVATQCATHARGPVLVMRPRAATPAEGPATPAPSR
jgi:nucleotide-binding universal stress UspA family protein